MKATICYLAILASIGFAGCAAESQRLATTSASQQPTRIPIQDHPIPHEMWGATSASIGKDSP